jgi:hypothetical protein
MDRTLLSLCGAVVSLPVLILPAIAASPEGSTAKGPVVLAQQCQQRVGPFATQGAAWQAFNQAQSQGYPKGVVGLLGSDHSRRQDLARDHR